MRHTSIEFLSRINVVEKYYGWRDINQDVTHITARAAFGQCPVCGRDIPGPQDAACPLHENKQGDGEC